MVKNSCWKGQIKTFSDLLLTIGNGTVATCDGHEMVNIPDGLGHVVDVDEEDPERDDHVVGGGRGWCALLCLIIIP